MANAAVLEPSNSNSFHFGRIQSDARMKRKPLSESTEEQMKRQNAEIKSDWISVGATGSLKKNDSSKVPKYVNTHLNEVYPIKKSSERCRGLYGKEKLMYPPASRLPNGVVDSSGGSSFAVNFQSSCLRGKAEGANMLDNPDSAANDGKSGVRKIEKCSQSEFRSIGEFHYGKEKPSDFAANYMQKAMKAFSVRNMPTSSSSVADPGKHSDAPSIIPSSSEFSIPGHKVPLDFALKTTLRLVSSSSVRWCHRLSLSPATVGIGHNTVHSCCQKDQKFECSTGSSGMADTTYSKALRSWIYPQSSLPATIISAMSLSVVKEEKDFLSRRQRDWEDSMRSVYYMLRKSMCNIFYVRTAQFVVMFTGDNILGKKRICNAYLSQSTLGLRSLLKKNGICFSMPLSCVEVEQAADDNLVELSEIKKQNLGQTIHMDSMSDVDNTPHSLLAFIGNENAHSLYDFLLNYRSFLNSFTGVDVPVLYAPVPFQNASLSVPEVRCKEMKRADVLPSSGSETVDTNVSFASSGSICYSLEIEDTIIPPWVVCGLCTAMSSDGRSFEASFITHSLSLGLNVALDSIHKASDNAKEEVIDLLGIPNAVPSPCLRSASLRKLRYSDGSYMAYVNPL